MKTKLTDEERQYFTRKADESGCRDALRCLPPAPADDLVRRLRDALGYIPCEVAHEAADRIEALQQRIDGPADDPYAALKAEIRSSLSPPADDLVRRLREMEAEVARLLPTYPKPDNGWQCYHCGEWFTTPGAARDHFGETPANIAGCVIKAGDERGLLMALRKAEARAAAAEADAARLRAWLDNNTTFYNVDADWPVEGPNVPTLAQVTNRIWYHATDDVDSYPFSAVADAARADAAKAGDPVK